MHLRVFFFLLISVSSASFAAVNLDQSQVAQKPVAAKKKGWCKAWPWLAGGASVIGALLLAKMMYKKRSGIPPIHNEAVPSTAAEQGNGGQDAVASPRSEQDNRSFPPVLPPAMPIISQPLMGGVGGVMAPRAIDQASPIIEPVPVVAELERPEAGEVLEERVEPEVPHSGPVTVGPQEAQVAAVQDSQTVDSVTVSGEQQSIRGGAGDIVMPIDDSGSPVATGEAMRLDEGPGSLDDFRFWVPGYRGRAPSTRSSVQALKPEWFLDGGCHWFFRDVSVVGEELSQFDKFQDFLTALILSSKRRMPGAVFGIPRALLPLRLREERGDFVFFEGWFDQKYLFIDVQSGGSLYLHSSVLAEDGDAQMDARIAESNATQCSVLAWLAQGTIEPSSIWGGLEDKLGFICLRHLAFVGSFSDEHILLQAEKPAVLDDSFWALYTLIGSGERHIGFERYIRDLALEEKEALRQRWGLPNVEALQALANQEDPLLSIALLALERGDANAAADAIMLLSRPVVHTAIFSDNRTLLQEVARRGLLGLVGHVLWLDADASYVSLCDSKEMNALGYVLKQWRTLARSQYPEVPRYIMRELIEKTNSLSGSAKKALEKDLELVLVWLVKLDSSGELVKKFADKFMPKLYKDVVPALLNVGFDDPFLAGLLEGSMALEEAGAPDGITPLMRLAELGLPLTLRSMLERSTQEDIMKRNKRGLNALLYALGWRHYGDDSDVALSAEKGNPLAVLEIMEKVSLAPRDASLIEKQLFRILECFFVKAPNVQMAGKWIRYFLRKCGLNEDLYKSCFVRCCTRAGLSAQARIQLLTEEPGGVMFRTEQGATVYMLAARKGWRQVMHHILTHCYGISQFKDSNGLNALLYSLGFSTDRRGKVGCVITSDAIDLGVVHDCISATPTEYLTRKQKEFLLWAVFELATCATYNVRTHTMMTAPGFAELAILLLDKYKLDYNFAHMNDSEAPPALIPLLIRAILAGNKQLADFLLKSRRVVLDKKQVLLALEEAERESQFDVSVRLWFHSQKSRLRQDDDGVCWIA